MLGQLDAAVSGFCMQPVGSVLDLTLLKRYPRLFQSVGQLVATLQQAHELGWLHAGAPVLLVLPSAWQCCTICCCCGCRHQA